MIKRTLLAAAAALAIFSATPASADNHSTFKVAQLAENSKFVRSLRRMSDRELRSTITRLEDTLRERNRPKFREQLNAAVAEYQRRQRAGGGGNSGGQASDAEQRARQLVSNPADANRLKTKALRNRINQARTLLDTPGVRKKTRRRLRRLIQTDRAELQARSQQQQQQEQVSRQDRRAVELIKGPRSNSLRPKALRDRIAEARDLIASNRLRPRTEKRLKALIASDTEALRARQQQNQVTEAEQRARRHLRRARDAGDISERELRKRIRTSRNLLEQGGLQPETDRRLRRLVKQDRQTLNVIENSPSSSSSSGAEQTARALLAAGVVASALNSRALRQRIRDSRSLLQDPDVRPKTRRRLKRQLDEDVAELDARRDQQVQSSAADEQARELLADERSPRDLRENQLRRRLRETRSVLQDPQLSQNNSRRLRKRLARDRRELRRRVEASQLDNIGDIVTRPVEDDNVRALLDDRRPSHSLRRKQLSRRVKRTQRALNTSGLSGYQRSALRDMLRSDRRELRNRLLQRRERRRAELARQRRDNEIRIEIVPQFEFAPREDIAAAEADGDLIERQLIAPPTREIDRRYTIDEFRRRPSLRRYMPAIEVDSIHFGFNEHFVREEEVDELERIGSVIERVVTKSPDEVFLIEGHTDAVGSDGYNLDLSRKRAQAVRSALLEFFVISPENLETIGYGEQFLKIPTPEEESENRRVTVRRSHH